MKMYLVAALALTLVACAKSDNSKGSGSENGEKSPTATYPIKKTTPLSPAQKEEIKGIMGSAVALPEMNLLLNEENLSEESKKEKAEQIVKLTAEQKQIIEKIQSDCLIEHPVRTSKGKQEAAGDIETAVTKAKIGGDKCPIQYVSIDNTENKLTKSNIAELLEELKKNPNSNVMENVETAGEHSGTKSEKVIIKAGDLQSLTKLKSKETRLTGKSTYASSKKASQTRSKMSGSVTLEYLSAKVEGSVQGDFQTSPDGEEDSYMEVTLQFPTSTAVVQTYQTKEGRKIFLNGVETTKEEMKEVFGEIALQ